MSMSRQGKPKPKGKKSWDVPLNVGLKKGSSSPSPTPVTKEPPRKSKAVRLQVSFLLGDGMTKPQANSFVRMALERAIKEYHPTIGEKIDLDSLQVFTFATP
jgi:hypothetical protein